MSVAPGGTAQSNPGSDYRALRPGLGIEEGVNHVAADVAGPASDQDRHVVSPFDDRVQLQQLFDCRYVSDVDQSIRASKLFTRLGFSSSLEFEGNPVVDSSIARIALLHLR
jgi:hypothetical protein